MDTHSILFATPEDAARAERREAPEFFSDLNLDRIVQDITLNRQDYDLVPFFYAPLRESDAVRYRQEVMQELEQRDVKEAVKTFAETMRRMRSYVPSKDRRFYRWARERWFLHAVEAYCEAVGRLSRDLDGLNLGSRGLRGVRALIGDYAVSEPFKRLASDAETLRLRLSEIRYELLVRGGSVTVRPFRDEPSYSAQVAETFRKFRQDAAAEGRPNASPHGGMNRLEAQILERVAHLHPNAFGALDAFCTEHADYLDVSVARFDREVQFYLAYLDYIDRLRTSGLPFCYPSVSTTSKEIMAEAAYDLALAHQRVRFREDGIVANDFFLRGPERVIVVSGPNQGGKTTFARMFGQLHYLASLGLPVPGKQARLFLCDHLFTHFERQERVESLRGRLHSELVRIRRILEEATTDSLIVINEIFSSTTRRDGLFLGRKVMERLTSLDALCVCVSFLDELSSFDEKTVSMICAVDPDDPTVRTFRLERKPADGLAYALSIAAKYHVTYDWLKKRIAA